MNNHSKYTMLALCAVLALAAGPAMAQSNDTGKGNYLGNLSANPYGANSTSNPYSSAGSAYSSDSINNAYGRYGSPYSTESATNPFATDAPSVAADVVEGLHDGAEVVWSPGILRWLFAVLRHLPRPIWRRVAARA